MGRRSAGSAGPERAGLSRHGHAASRLAAAASPITPGCEVGDGSHRTVGGGGWSRPNSGSPPDSPPTGVAGGLAVDWPRPVEAAVDAPVPARSVSGRPRARHACAAGWSARTQRTGSRRAAAESRRVKRRAQPDARFRWPPSGTSEPGVPGGGAPSRDGVEPPGVSGPSLARPGRKPGARVRCGCPSASGPGPAGMDCTSPAAEPVESAAPSRWTGSVCLERHARRVRPSPAAWLARTASVTLAVERAVAPASSGGLRPGAPPLGSPPVTGGARVGGRAPSGIGGGPVAGAGLLQREGGRRCQCDCFRPESRGSSIWTRGTPGAG